MKGPVVVGVDGSASDRGVVEAAAREADRRDTALRLVHAMGWSAGAAAWDPAGRAVRERVSAILTEAERRARQVAPHLDVAQDVLIGDPGPVLETESSDASLAVVGGRCPEHPHKGSVAGHLSTHARCPVLVVRGRPEPGGTVVLAGDGSPGMREAAEFAFAEAAARGADLTALHPHVLAGMLHDLRAAHPGVTVHDHPVPGRFGRTVTVASAHAQLVVLAARGRRRMAWEALRRSLLRDAGCPVAVVPAPGR
ncbi:universal stress protein [Streptomyces sp. NPDC026672]|uniref:universal stress protein n=1 Tax=unclassified Streptomyces TaxID=2593676 RepID=UPI0033F90624